MLWRGILDDLAFRGNERLLDLGCGRGAVLLAATRRLPRGRAVGIDLWKTADQSGNDPAITRRNAALEGVADRVELVTGDMRSLPFLDASFDAVTSSLAIHNITDPAGRAKEVDEAVRVLRLGGRLAIVDIGAAKEYATRLRERGMRDVSVRGLGPHGWFGGPWVACRLVTATRPA